MPDTQRSDCLWHYTDLGGLLGITEKMTLRATDARYLNDSQELAHGLERLQQAWDHVTDAKNSLFEGEELSEEAADLTNFEKLSRIGEVAASDLTKVTVEAPDPPPFVACFCAQGDLLSQWRGYAAGTGFALGFAKKDLQQLASTTSNGHQTAQLLKIEYVKDKVPAAGSKVDENGKVVLTAIEQAWFKHPGFEEEQEWRVAITSSPKSNRKFRQGSQGLTPYIELHLAQCAPREVRIGPGGDRELRDEALRHLLDAVGWKSTKISRSETPYRG